MASLYCAPQSAWIWTRLQNSRDHDILSRSDQGTLKSTITGDWVRGSLFHHPSRYIIINTHSFHLVNTVQAKGTSKGGPDDKCKRLEYFDSIKRRSCLKKSTHIHQATFSLVRPAVYACPRFFHAYPGAGRSGCPLVQFGELVFWTFLLSAYTDCV